MTDEKIDPAIDKVCQQIKLPYRLKAEQRQILQALARNKHVLGLLPTGFGKSDCYGLIPLIMDELSPRYHHVAVVVSPLRSLMMDQVIRYEQMGIRALAILRRDEVSQEQEKALREGAYSLVLTSPESIFLEPWSTILRSWRERVCTVAVDEAHCLSSWGNDFRKSYLRIVELRSILTKVPFLILTATATQKMVNDILDKLCLSSHDIYKVTVLPNRPNIYLDFKRVSGNISKDLGWLAAEMKNSGAEAPKTIIYARTIDTVTAIYASLMRLLGMEAWAGEKCSANVRVEMFHGSTDGDTQEYILKRFKDNSALRIVVATVAFGLGVQVSDIERVVHWGASRTILGYWQECGRCARDGRDGTALLYLPPHGLNKLQVSEEMIDLVREVESEKLCMRKALLRRLFVEGMRESDVENCSLQSARCCISCSSTND